jgi:hypothetical protein
VRLTVPLRLDGQLDEAIYQTVLPASDFVQTDPNPGVAATEKTELWVMFDSDNMYVGARLWESQPDRMVVNEMRKDSANVFQNETFSFIFDTFYDKRNAVGFIINPIGGRQDGQITWRLRSRSNRCDIVRARAKSGVSSPAASTGGRTSCRT